MEKNLHFIGIGGIGMSAIARILLDQGYQISGSDMAESALTQQLCALGAQICYGHDAANIPATAQAVVYSSAVKMDNCEIIAAQKRNLPIYQRAQMLAHLLQLKRGIGVAGAHGKTTVSAMIATMLELSGLDPTIIIGGMLPVIGSNAKPGSGDYIVAEADESDGSFLLLKPHIAIITNIESDHVDFYQDFEHTCSAFSEYLAQVPTDGFAILGHDCPSLRACAADFKGRAITYGLAQDSDYTILDIKHSPFAIEATVYYQGQELGLLKLNVPGLHNMINALAAVALGCQLGLSFEQIATSLAEFRGTKRRFELLAKHNDIFVIDDYAHHPTEVAATINTAIDMQIAQRVVAVFQPHRYSRTLAMYADFAQSLLKADLVIVQELYSAFEAPIEGVSAQMVVDEARRLGYQNIIFSNNHQQTIDYLRQQTCPNDLLLIMGAGNIRSVGEGFISI